MFVPHVSDRLAFALYSNCLLQHVDLKSHRIIFCWLFSGEQNGCQGVGQAIWVPEHWDGLLLWPIPVPSFSQCQARVLLSGPGWKLRVAARLRENLQDKNTKLLFFVFCLLNSSNDTWMSILIEHLRKVEEFSAAFFVWGGETNWRIPGCSPPIASATSLRSH